MFKIESITMGRYTQKELAEMRKEVDRLTHYHKLGVDKDGFLYYFNKAGLPVPYVPRKHFGGRMFFYDINYDKEPLRFWQHKLKIEQRFAEAEKR